MASGNLLFAREAHYQPLTQLCFTADEALLFTGGEDAAVHSWRLLDLVDFNLRSEEILPVQSWNEHTLAITEIICGSGTAMNARVYTSSLDHTIKVDFRALHLIIDLGRLYIIFVNNDIVP
jgi:pre-rRNA-processing protein IPI3